MGSIPVPSLQFYNFSSQEWFNISARAYTPDGTVICGSAAYDRLWGTTGLFVAFGGQTSPSMSQFLDCTAYLSMSNLLLFDLSTQSWFYKRPLETSLVSVIRSV